MSRTSQTHPLRINAVPVANGLLGLTICPGKHADSLTGAPWARDLEIDVRAIADWGATLIITLTETDEMNMLGVSALPSVAGAAGIDWRHFPIRDVDVPDASTDPAWRKLSPVLHRTLEAGGRVLVHCRGGLGRAGTIAALVLIERGTAPKEAIAAVRKVRPGAVETREQEQWLIHRGIPRHLRARRIHASLLGGAVGDSLGADIEFMSLADISRRFPNGWTDLPPHQGLRGAITDDTQMTLFTAEGLIRAAVRGNVKGICHPPGVVHHALLRWFRTQGRHPLYKTDDNVGLVADPRLNVLRAPGNTCLDALSRAKFINDMAVNNSKGCGTIMRVAPVAFFGSRSNVRALAIETSALTHGHPTGQLAAAAWAEILADVLEGEDLESAARAIASSYSVIPDGGETARAIQAACDAPRDGNPETVESLGGGWVAEEALAIALYAGLASDNFDQGIRIAVMHSGDSDSTGAIAGNLLGLLYPEEALAHPWVRQLECSDLIVRIARDLGNAMGFDEDQFDDYPGW